MEIWPLLLLHAQGKLSYAQGVEIYHFCHPSSPLKDFYKVEDRYSRRQLKTFLDQKYEALSKNKQANTFKSFGVSKYALSKINLEILPEDLRIAHARLSPLIREISSLHSRLFNCTSDLQRYEVCLKMYPLIIERRLIFSRIDQYVLTGTDILKKTPDTVQVKKMPDLPMDYEVEYNLKKLRVQRSKLKKNPRRIEEYNQVCAQINELLSKRHG